MTGFTFFVGLFFFISSVTSFDFNLRKITILTAMTTIMGIVLILISVISFFKQRDNSKNH